MKPTRSAIFLALALASALILAPHRASAEVLEEIVARVNDDPVTRTDLQAAEQEAMEELSAKKSGDSLEKELARARSELLQSMITKRLLIQKAERMFDVVKMQDAFIRQFKEQNKIATTTELEKILKDEGFTLDEFRKKIIEVNAPGTVIDTDVKDKISVSDAEVEAYYKAHASELASPERVWIREIILKSDFRPLDETIKLARTIVAEARAEGADFTALAQKDSEVDTNLRGIALGPFTKGELAPDLEEVAFGLKPGAVSDPITVGPAVHIIRLDKHEDSVVPPLDSVKDKLTLAIERAKFEVALNKYIDELWSKADICVADEYIERLPVDYRKYIKC